MKSLRKEISYHFILPSLIVLLFLSFSLIAVMSSIFKRGVMERVRREVPVLVKAIAEKYDSDPGRRRSRPIPMRKFLGYEVRDTSGKLLERVPDDISRKTFFKLSKKPFVDLRRGIAIDIFLRRDRMYTEVESKMAHGFFISFGINAVLLALLFIFMAGKLSRRIMKVNSKSAQELLKIADGDYDRKYTPRFSEFLPMKNGVEKMALLLKNEEKRKTDFIRGLSHDMRTPVTIIKGTVEGIVDGVLQDRKKAYKDISEEISRIEDLLDRIGDFGREPVHSRTYSSPLEIIEHFRERYSRLMTISFKGEDEDVPLGEEALYKIFDNLFSNAYKYNSKSGKTCVVECSICGTDVILSVCDNGDGIKDDDMPYIFDQFYRGNSSRTGRNGSGMGLSIVKDIITGAGGAVNVESGEGGSCFYMRFERKG